MNFDIAELERRVSNLIRIGVIEEADYTRALVRVRLDGFSSEWLPWATRRAGGDIDWWAPEVGEQVMVLCPSGLIESAVAMPALYSNSRAEPASSPDIHTIHYGNGDSVTHNRADGSFTLVAAGNVTATIGGNLSATVSGTTMVDSGGAVTVKAPSVTLDTPQTTCTGNLLVQKKLTYQGGMAGSGGLGAAAAITGNLAVTGDVSAGGSVSDAGGNTNHHSH